MIRRFEIRFLLGALLVVALLAGACGKKHGDLTGVPPLDPSDIPPIPVGVTVTVATSRVTLSWQVDDASGVTEYRIYRQEQGIGAFLFLASTAGTTFADAQVVNGVTYRYQVAAVKGVLEGDRSVTVVAVPNVYSVLLEGGATATNGNNIQPGSRRIEYSLVAPAATISYQISEDSTFAGSPVRGFDASAPTGSIALSPGDGLKTLWVRFTGEGGAVSERVASTILLDTRAVIEQVTEDSGGVILGVNDVLHITMEVDTTGGIAEADIGDAYFNLRLLDDGTNGDVVALDGIYERDFVITAGLEVVNAVIVGSFRDLVGNDANEVFSATKVTIADPPGPVAFSRTSIEVLGTAITLRWSENGDSDFAGYRLFRTPPDDVGDPVTEDDVLMTTITDRTQRTFVTSSLVGDSFYMFGVQAIDDNGFTAPLDTVTVKTNHDPAISNATLSPTLGTPGTNFTYGCRYRHPGGLAPTNVRVVVDGGVTYDLAQVGGGSNWVGGENFSVTTNLGPGSHTYYFEVFATDGSNARLPVSTVFGGPVVTN